MEYDIMKLLAQTGQQSPQNMSYPGMKMPLELPDAITQAFPSGPSFPNAAQLAKLDLTRSKPSSGGSIEEMLKQKQLQSLESQRSGIAEFEKLLGSQQKPAVNPMVAILQGASDIFSGTNNVAQMQQNKEQTEAKDLQHKVLLQNMKRDLTKEEINALEAQVKEKNDMEKMRMLFANKDTKADEKTQRLESGVFTEWQKNDITKKSQDVATAYEKVSAAAKDPSAAGDISLLFGYMKMLDPGSVVREGEFATAQNAAGVPDKIRNMWNKALTGERLNPAQRLDFTGQAQKVYGAQLAQQKRWDQTVKKRAENLGLDPSKIVLGETLFGDAYTGQPGKVTPQEDPEFQAWKKARGHK